MAIKNENTIGFAKHAAIVVGVALTGIGLALAIWYAIDIFFLIFFGVLMSVLLRAPADYLAKTTPLTPGFAFALVCTLAVGAFVIVSWIWAPVITSQGEELIATLPRSPGALKAFVEQYDWGRATLGWIPGIYPLIFETSHDLALDRDVLLSPFKLLGAGLFVAFVTLYVGGAPHLYKQGVILILPLSVRARGHEILNMLAHTLRWWLIGRAISMASVGLLTFLMLTYFEVPLALVLGVLAAGLTFVPYLGPLAAGVPIAIVTLIQVPEDFIVIILAYTVIQLLEGYLLTPVVQRATVYVPPAVTLAAEVLMGALFGIIGVIVATPLTAVLFVLSRMVYVHDLLGDRASPPLPESKS